MQRDDSDFADFFGVADGGSFFGEIDEALKVKDPSTPPKAGFGTAVLNMF